MFCARNSTRVLTIVQCYTLHECLVPYFNSNISRTWYHIELKSYSWLSSLRKQHWQLVSITGITGVYHSGVNIDNLIGCKSGFIFIDLVFKKWLKNLLGEKNYQKLDSAELVHKIVSHSTEGSWMRELMSNFNQWKRRFNKDHGDIKMNLSDSLHNLNLDMRVVGGEIRITKSVIT